MTWRRRRRGLFEGPPRVLFRRTGSRYGFLERPAVPLKGKAAAVRLYAPRPR
jgi:hypothetical protein